MRYIKLNSSSVFLSRNSDYINKGHFRQSIKLRNTFLQSHLSSHNARGLATMPQNPTCGTPSMIHFWDFFPFFRFRILRSFFIAIVHEKINDDVEDSPPARRISMKMYIVEILPPVSQQV
ncbi:hypothetical protein CDAR_587351 [Caerostris darwini]|uniref:Uncharacterized protein n=1 Tax=Caerostris darwini TaxID=1538125 RepID=A0AAV4SML1_9ARAC|nr:hypothetical protein CDAR_587351 [Caerostris darwini]